MPKSYASSQVPAPDPKIEHVHLEGTVRPDTARIATRNDYALPGRPRVARRLRDFTHFPRRSCSPGRTAPRRLSRVVVAYAAEAKERRRLHRGDLRAAPPHGIDTDEVFAGYRDGADTHCTASRLADARYPACLPLEDAMTTAATP
jgi:hypothetical protein